MRIAALLVSGAFLFCTAASALTPPQGETPLLQVQAKKKEKKKETKEPFKPKEKGAY